MLFETWPLNSSSFARKPAVIPSSFGTCVFCWFFCKLNAVWQSLARRQEKLLTNSCLRLELPAVFCMAYIKTIDNLIKDWDAEVQRFSPCYEQPKRHSLLKDNHESQINTDAYYAYLEKKIKWFVIYVTFWNAFENIWRCGILEWLYSAAGLRGNHEVVILDQGEYGAFISMLCTSLIVLKRTLHVISL